MIPHHKKRIIIDNPYKKFSIIVFSQIVHIKLGKDWINNFQFFNYSIWHASSLRRHENPDHPLSYANILEILKENIEQLW